MKIETQLAADDNIMHFFAESGFCPRNNMEFSDGEAAMRSVLAESLLQPDGVAAVVITPDCLSVFKKVEASWENLKPQILAEIADCADAGKLPLVDLPPSDVLRRITGLINARIRPAIRKDGGDIVVRGFDDGIVYVELQGKCVGCPYSQRTLKDGVERLLRTYIKEVVAVEKYEN